MNLRKPASSIFGSRWPHVATGTERLQRHIDSRRTSECGDSRVSVLLVGNQGRISFVSGLLCMPSGPQAVGWFYVS